MHSDSKTLDHIRELHRNFGTEKKQPSPLRAFAARLLLLGRWLFRA